MTMNLDILAKNKHIISFIIIFIVYKRNYNARKESYLKIAYSRE